jgi:transposase-like protein
VAAAKAVLRKARHTQAAAAPTGITLDGYAASHRAVRELATENPTLEKTKRRSSKYLNHMIEQDHINAFAAG